MGRIGVMDQMVRVAYFRLEAPLGWLFYLADFMREELWDLIQVASRFYASLKPLIFISDLVVFLSQPQYSYAPHYMD